MITIRLATEADRRILLEWRNDPDTRAASSRPDPVDPEDHDAWFSRTLLDPGRFLYLGEVDGERVGMIRFDRRVARAEVSINLSPDFRGRGLSRDLLSAAIAQLGQDTQHAQIVLTARIREDNAASLRIFGELGFEPTGKHEGGFGVFERAPRQAPD